MANCEQGNDSPLGVAVRAVVDLFEQLGVCVAIAAGGIAIAHFRAKVLPFCPTAAAIYGIILLFGALFLALLVSGAWFTQQTSGRPTRWYTYLLVGLVVVTTVLFFIAGVYSAIASLNAA